MYLIDKDDAKEISEAIIAQEEKTSGEIVAVLAAQSGSYRLLPLFVAAFIALLIPLILIYLPRYTEGQFLIWSAEKIYFIQLLCFVALALILSFRPLRYWIVPIYMKKKWAHAHALEQFAAQEMHTTSGRTGIMIFVSVAEHHAEIIGDMGIYEKIPAKEWDALVRQLALDIKNKKPKKGFITAINQSGAWLAEHFPPGSEPVDELVNHLIVIE